MNANSNPIMKKVLIKPNSNTCVSVHPDVFALLIAEIPTVAKAPIITSAITV